VAEGDIMTDQSSELVEISKLNGGSRKNYGNLIDANLCLKSINAVRGRSLLWTGVLFAMVSAGVAWLKQCGWLSAG
jgi:hypothetical protein